VDSFEIKGNLSFSLCWSAIRVDTHWKNIQLSD
jgi:hypothetical protein